MRCAQFAFECARETVARYASVMVSIPSSMTAVMPWALIDAGMMSVRQRCSIVRLLALVRTRVVGDATTRLPDATGNDFSRELSAPRA